MPLTADQIQIVQDTLHAASSLSFSGSLLTIVAFLILRRTHMRYPQNLVFLLAFNSVGFDSAWAWARAARRELAWLHTAPAFTLLRLVVAATRHACLQSHGC